MATKVKLIADGVITPDQITLTTASTGTNTTAPATTAFVQQEISALVDSSPEALNTLNELAAALGDDANFSTTVTNSIATKAPLASPTFTGDATFDTSTLVIDSTNNRVGIGISPLYKLHISGTSGSNILRVQDTGNNAGIGIGADATNGAEINYGGVDTLRFVNASTERMRIDSSGNVGIGTNNPLTTFQVKVATNYNFMVQSALSSTALKFLNDGGTAYTVGTINADSLIINADSGGNVGIGTTSPQTDLHVSGNITIDNSSNTPYINFVENADITDSKARIAMDQIDGSNGSLLFYTEGSGSLVERARISSDGHFDFQNNRITKFKLTDYQYNIISPTAGNYAGFRFMGPNSTDDWGYFLAYDGTDNADYQNHGVSLITDNGPLSLAARGALVGASQPQRNFIRFSTSSSTSNTNTERMRIDKDGNITMPNQPKFHAFGGGSTPQGSDVIYVNTYVNDGGHYNTSNGRFTAPVAGVYLFFWSAIGDSTNDVYRWYLRLNGSQTISGTGNDIHLRQDTSSTGSEYATNGSRVQMLDLAVNDYVTINFQSDSNNAHYVGSDYVNFGGYLIG